MIGGPKPAAPFLKDRKDPAQAVMWWPAHTITSCDNTLAFSTGPWMRNGGKSSGRYFTIWRHDESGWRWVYDGGAGTPEPMAAGESVKATQAACGPGVPISPPPFGVTAGGGSRDGSLKWFLVDIGGGQFELNVLYRFGDHAWNTERAVIG